MQCPRCSIELDATSRHECAQCGGAFVGDAELNEMLSTMDAQQEPLDRRTTANWPVGEDRSERVCPVCTTAMFRMTMERVTVERCPPHGVWFDREELQRVLSPFVDEQTYAFDHKGRQLAADMYEYGSLGVLVRLVYSRLRRAKRTDRH